MPGTDYDSAISFHICHNVSCAGGYIPGMFTAYENQALEWPKSGCVVVLLLGGTDILHVSLLS